MTASPGPTPTPSPALPPLATRAIPSSELVQLASVVTWRVVPSANVPVAISPNVPPTGTDVNVGLTRIEVSVAGETSTLAEPLTPANVAVTTVVPRPTAVTTPAPPMPFETTTTPPGEEPHIADCVR